MRSLILTAAVLVAAAAVGDRATAADRSLIQPAFSQESDHGPSLTLVGHRYHRDRHGHHRHSRHHYRHHYRPGCHPPVIIHPPVVVPRHYYYHYPYGYHRGYGYYHGGRVGFSFSF